ncbi:putative AraC-like transcription regulator [Streptomyces afghaniensis 772]|uniref:Putative AraC-like transcription regulator n=1 Tax=Streptomyces afghaniensis 772 TaxID=1283301 RepID=S4NGA6_9ACTN|nr:putative AraC-like transcription regulator [Streptomyces afghaniensis 772]
MVRRPEAEAPAWYRALADPVVGGVLRLLQDNPAHPWTVAALAAKAGVSRAALARRFTALVGEPPMAYLTGWRLALAADRLRDSEDTLDAVARRVGYGSAFALSTAFKRVYGVSPVEYRGRGRSGREPRCPGRTPWSAAVGHPGPGRSRQPRGRRRSLAHVYVERASRLAGAVVWSNAPERDGAARVLPDGCMDLLWHEGRLLVAGPDTHAYVTDGETGA